MKIRLFDVFDRNFTVAVYEDVDFVDGNIVYFKDGEKATFDPQYVDWEEVVE